MENNIKKVKFRNKLKIEIEILDISTVYKKFENNDLDFDISKFHRPQFNMILLVENETSKHFIDFKTYALCKNDLLFVGENSVHAFSLNNKLKGRAIIFTSNFIKTNNISIKSFKNLFSISVIKTLGEDSTVKELFNILNKEYNKEEANKIDLYKYILASLLTKLELLIDKDKVLENNNEYTKIILKLNSLIEKSNYKCRDSLKFSKEMGYSYKHLNIISKFATGYTLKQYIDHLVVLEMKRQLVANNMSLNELSIFFDFNEETNLVKYFKRLVGESPKKFKDKYKNFNG